MFFEFFGKLLFLVGFILGGFMSMFFVMFISKFGMFKSFFLLMNFCSILFLDWVCGSVVWFLFFCCDGVMVVVVLVVVVWMLVGDSEVGSGYVEIKFGKFMVVLGFFNVKEVMLYVVVVIFGVGYVLSYMCVVLCGFWIFDIYFLFFNLIFW